MVKKGKKDEDYIKLLVEQKFQPTKEYIKLLKETNARWVLNEIGASYVQDR
jgi:hypothetical protein